MSAALRALRAVHASISFGARGLSRSASEPGGSLVARPRRPSVQFVLEKEIPMLTALSGYIRDRWPFSHTVRIAGLENFVERCHAEAWHIYAIKKRIWRRHVCVACGWLADSLPRDARIFEPGCGSGANLLWLAQQGFTRLQGADISAEVVALCRGLSHQTGASLDVWQDDGLAPTRPPRRVDAILSVNWLYHIPGASMESFLRTYRPCLNTGGKIVCDVVDASYNRVTDNEFHTRDRHLPPLRRRPSEYTFRLSREEMENIAARHGFSIVRHTLLRARPQRAVYLLESR